MPITPPTVGSVDAVQPRRTLYFKCEPCSDVPLKINLPNLTTRLYKTGSHRLIIASI